MRDFLVCSMLFLQRDFFVLEYQPALQVSEQFSFLAYCPFGEQILGVSLDLERIRFAGFFSFTQYEPSEFIIPLHLVLELVSHAKFVDIK